MYETFKQIADIAFVVIAGFAIFQLLGRRKNKKQLQMQGYLFQDVWIAGQRH